MLTKMILSFLNRKRYTYIKTWCPVCNAKNVRFTPLDKSFHKKAMHYGYKYFGKGEMASIETYTCSNCGASDRERLYAAWIEQQISNRKLLLEMRLIHFAPEPALSRKIKGLRFFNYKAVDFCMVNVDCRVNIMELPFREGSFDFFICSHVLEHVKSDDLAIKELYRITKHGGCGILVAPIVVGLERTLEDHRITDEAGRWKMFGQNDHVRLYAHNDYVNKISSHGFIVEQLGEKYFGEHVFNSLGLSKTSMLYIVRK